MRYIFSRYALWFNKKYQRKGHLFGGPYRQSVCLDPTYLLAASVYIHLNPVRAGLVKDPTKYRWSSWSLYCKDEPAQSFVDPGPVLELLDKDKIQASRQYELILREGAGLKQDNLFEKKGTVEKFCFMLEEMFPSIFKRIARAWASSPGEKNTDSEPNPVEKLSKEFKDMPASRNTATKQARRYIVEQLLARGFQKSEIAARLGVSRKTIYNILNSE
ncbi:helix-turn-helix domain-containing protein [Desulfonatronospira sp.]|uniref:helix-turn-helix domain-containing protein n=1 Tax=Desulfonatronospira sp. TaxID=1962951 RepID=UPI0025B89732|nr:helix-turn-helix domain-containing protein [Desulfonatronospira sp.]